eukprot:778021-Pyramimonas_sp.AAC.2
MLVLFPLPAFPRDCRPPPACPRPPPTYPHTNSPCQGSPLREGESIFGMLGWQRPLANRAGGARRHVVAIETR